MYEGYSEVSDLLSSLNMYMNHTVLNEDTNEQTFMTQESTCKCSVTENCSQDL
jgi:hypothetical protein